MSILNIFTTIFGTRRRRRAALVEAASVAWEYLLYLPVEPVSSSLPPGTHYAGVVRNLHDALKAVGAFR